QNWRDLPRDTPLVKVEVLRYDIKRSKVRSGNNVIHGMSYQWNKTNKNIRVILHSIHSDDGNPTIANIKQALSRIQYYKLEILSRIFFFKLNLPDHRYTQRWRYLILAELN
ncbi:hypothetical protein Tco_0903508, partial [Tanacetum coccineum]